MRSNSDSINTKLDIYPEMILGEETDGITVVIHHDFYSSDDDHGRELLRSMLDVFADESSRISRIIFIGSAVILLDGDLANIDLHPLLSTDISIIACKESIEQYSVSISCNVTELSMSQITLELMNSINVFNVG